MDTVQTDYSPEVKAAAQDVLIARLGLGGRFTEETTFAEKRQVIGEELGVEPNVAEYIHTLLWGDQET